MTSLRIDFSKYLQYFWTAYNHSPSDYCLRSCSVISPYMCNMSCYSDGNISKLENVNWLFT